MTQAGGQETGAPHRPIFVVGAHRSGTTLLRLTLDSHPRISCGPETRFLADLSRITGDNWHRMRLYGYPKQYWYDQVARLFHDFQMGYAQRRGKSRWADKTPMYAVHLEYIDRLFPNCQLVHVIRDGRDVVASHRDKWGYGSAAKATGRWARYVNDVRSFAGRLPPDRYHEVRYEDVVRDGPRTLAGLLDFLDEPWDDAVLAPDQAPHDVPERYGAFTASRRRSGDGQAVYQSRVGSGRREMDPFLATLFRLRSGRTLRDLGYR